MSYWIEVTMGIRWQRMLDEGEIRLDAPNRKRYVTFFSGMSAGDFVLHYLTRALTPSKLKEKKGSIFAISKVTSDPRVVGNKIVAKCSHTSLLQKPIPRALLEKVEGKSEGLEKLLRVSMMRYLTKISDSDFKSIAETFPGNRKVIRKVVKSEI